MTDSAGSSLKPPRARQPLRGQRSAPALPHLTPRAAILAIALCAVALSLAYPVREYIAQRKQLDQLQEQRAQIAGRLNELSTQAKRLTEPAFIEQQARDQLHMCLPMQMCYEIILPVRHGDKAAAARRAVLPWYVKLWSSVQQADSAAQRQRPTAQRR